MPKIKSGASGRRRARQEQRRDLKSAGGGDSLEGAGVGLGRVFRQDRGLGWGHWGWPGPALKAHVPRFLGRRRRPSVLPLGSYPPEGIVLKQCVGFGSKRDVLVPLVGAGIFRPPTCFLLRNGLLSNFGWKIKAVSCFFQDSCSTRGLGSTFWKILSLLTALLIRWVWKRKGCYWVIDFILRDI